MKNLFIIPFFLFLSFSGHCNDTVNDIKSFAKIATDYISESKDYSDDFKVNKVEKKIYLKPVFRSYLKNKENLARARFITFVNENPDEYGEEAEDAKENPTKYLGVNYLFEINEVYKIYKSNKFIGYAFNCSDHVDGEIIQDGSWSMIYLDTNMNFVISYEGQA